MMSGRAWEDFITINQSKNLRECNSSTDSQRALFLAIITIYREKSNSDAVLIVWQGRGNDFVVFVGQFPYLSDCVAEL